MFERAWAQSCLCLSALLRITVGAAACFTLLPRYQYLPPCQVLDSKAAFKGKVLDEDVRVLFLLLSSQALAVARLAPPASIAARGLMEFRA